MTNDEEMVGKHIREARKKRGLSQVKLAKASDISSSTLSAYENSKKIPNLITSAKIARSLGVPIDWLYNGDESVAFINSSKDEGRKIVNCIHVLWELGVINYYDDRSSGSFYGNTAYGGSGSNCYLTITNYALPITRLIGRLNEYRENEDTYSEPEQFIEMQLASIATEINKSKNNCKEKQQGKGINLSSRNGISKRK